MCAWIKTRQLWPERGEQENTVWHWSNKNDSDTNGQSHKQQKNKKGRTKPELNPGLYKGQMAKTTPQFRLKPWGKKIQHHLERNNAEMALFKKKSYWSKTHNQKTNAASVAWRISHKRPKTHKEGLHRVTLSQAPENPYLKGTHCKFNSSSSHIHIIQGTVNVTSAILAPAFADGFTMTIWGFKARQSWIASREENRVRIKSGVLVHVWKGF